MALPLIPMLLAILIVFVAGVYRAYYNHANYWRRRGVPGPPSKIFRGHLDFLGNHLSPDCFQLQKWTKKYGKVFGYQKGWRNFLCVSDSKVVAEMMNEQFQGLHSRALTPIREDVDNDPDVNVFRARGNRWKRLRTLSNPAFSVQNLKKIIPILHDSAIETVKFLDKEAISGSYFNIHPYFHEFTMDTISRIAMGQTESKQFRNEYTKILLKLLAEVNHPIMEAGYIFPILKRFFAYVFHFYGVLKKRGAVSLYKMCAQAVVDRKASRAKGVVSQNEIDFIDLFLDAENNDLQHDLECANVYDKSRVHVEKKLTTKEVIAQCFVLLIAGFDTTANTLALTCYYLAIYPEIQENLRREIEQNCIDVCPTYEELNKLKYADAIMKEVLRLNPVGTGVFNRTASQDLTLGGISIEAGTHIQVDTFSLHRDKTIWGEDADEFKPERFLGEKPAPMLYGFGGGPRICIGMRLAYLEDKIALVHILRKYRIVPTPSTRPPSFTGLVVLNPDAVIVQLKEY